MYIEIKEIGPEGLAISRSIGAFRLHLSGRDSIQVDTVHLSVEMNKDADGISFAGRTETEANTACAR